MGKESTRNQHKKGKSNLGWTCHHGEWGNTALGI